LLEVIYVIRNEIGQVGIFGVIPNHIHWINVGGISRQPFDLKSVDISLLQQAHGLVMHTVTIQHQDGLAPQMPVNQAQRGHHVVKADVALLQLKVQTQSSALRRQG
jgi:hypothetical protein